MDNEKFYSSISLSEEERAKSLGFLIHLFETYKNMGIFSDDDVDIVTQHADLILATCYMLIAIKTGQDEEDENVID